LCLLLLRLNCSGQQSPFKAGVIFGRNSAQIDGDYQSGYKKGGYTYGIRGGYVLNKQLDLMTELLYVEKGASPKEDNITINRRRADIRYTYAEIPLCLNHHFREKADGSYLCTAYVGASYGKLLEFTSNVVVGNKTDILATNSINQANLNKQDYAFITGLNFSLIHNLYIGIRTSTSMNFVYKNPNPKYQSNGILVKDEYVQFRNYYISMQMQYDFISPKVKTRKAKITRKIKS
jgi:hypothetical protein